VSLWVSARVNVNKLPADQRAVALDWVRSLGQEPAQLVPTLVVTQDERDRSYRAHFSRFVLNAGKKQIDHAAGGMWTEPVVVPIPEPPTWLLDAHVQQLIEDGGQ